LNETCFTRSTCPSDTNCINAPACGMGCFCGRTTEGNIICHQNYAYCNNPIPCASTSECNPGRVCLNIAKCNCSTDGACVEPCPSPE
jgi:hypothetical protein